MTVPPFGVWPPVVIPTPTPPGPPAPPTFAEVLAAIAPLHWWLATQTTESGGLVDSLNDQGSSPLNFAQAGAARAPLALDGNGNPYLALDGAADFYQAGAAADWAFLNNGSACTLAIAYHRAALIVADEVLLDCANFTSNNIGLTFFLDFVSAAVQGIRSFVGNGSGGLSPIGCTSLVPSTALTTAVQRFSGDNTNASGSGATPLPIDMVLRRKGLLVCTSSRNANTFNTANPSFTLTLGRQANAAGAFSAARIYEIVIDNKAWSDRQVLMWEDYARNAYSIPNM